MLKSDLFISASLAGFAFIAVGINGFDLIIVVSESVHRYGIGKGSLLNCANQAIFAVRRV